MVSTKRKPAKRGRKNARAAKKPRSRSPSPVVVAEPALRQGLLEMATVGAHSFLWLATFAATVAALAAAGFGIWSLRPIPAYSSEGVTAGSAFAVTFRVDNASAWFPLSQLKIRCALTAIDMPDMPSVDAEQPQIPARLGPGEQAPFTCPFRTADPDVALRSEIYFRSEYVVPVLGALRLTDNRGPFVLNTRLLPPRWTAKPGKY